VTTEGIKD